MKIYNRYLVKSYTKSLTQRGRTYWTAKGEPTVLKLGVWVAEALLSIHQFFVIFSPCRQFANEQVNYEF